MTIKRPYIAQTSAGDPISPNDGIVPILEQIAPNKLKVVGTGFYITRYGLFMTARHVLDDICGQLDEQNKVTQPCFVLHNGEDSFHLRAVRRYHLLQPVDLAIAHAENFIDKFPDNPLINLRGGLSTSHPAPGTPIVTYAYPENEILDFSDPNNTPHIIADYYDGVVTEYIKTGPYMPYPHFRTSIDIRSGASGGPVFCAGKIIGISCRGWDFAGAELENEPLSSIIPISAALPLEVDNLMLPPQSWEYAQIPQSHRDNPHTLEELAQYGHVELDAVSK